MSLLIFFIILSFLILIHELGHFLAAKKNGVRVEEFGLGLPPRLFGKKIGETIYSLNLLPIGGFVKLFGEEQYELEGKKEKKQELKKVAFIYKKPWQKTIIILAGVFMNLLAGIIIFYITLSLNNFQSTSIPLITKTKFTFGQENKKVIIANVNKNSPAFNAGIKPEDVVLGYKINGNEWKNIDSASEFINIVKNTKDQLISFKLQNNKNGEEKIITVKPVYNQDLKRYIIGVNVMDIVILNYQKPVDKIFAGIFHSYNLMDYNLKIFGHLFSTAIKEKDTGTLTNSLSGPVGIFAVVDDTVKRSGQKLLINILELAGLISLSLALMNVLPFPALDGGRLIFVIYEWITGKQPNKNIEKYLNFFGFLILIGLAIFISINDIAKFFR